MSKPSLAALACRKAVEMSPVLTIQLKVGGSVSSRHGIQKMGVDAQMSSLSLTSSAHPFATVLALTCCLSVVGPILTWSLCFIDLLCFCQVGD